MVIFKTKSRAAITLTLLILAALAILFLRQNTKQPQTPVQSGQIGITTQQLENQNQSQNPTETRKPIEVVAQNLNIPWELVFISDGEILITERPGTLLIFKDNKKIQIESVKPIGEGGLLGMAIHPNFKNNRYIYLYLTSQTGSQTTNQVDRYALDGNSLKDRRMIFAGIRGAANHDGGRIAFGPDGLLYITVGDAQNENNSQDTNSLNGKILRIKDNGSIPTDNPFGNAVYSYGHRNPQGLAWDDKGQLWATEHGRSGALSGLDELNLIEKGKNYGWPNFEGDKTQQGMTAPVTHSGPTTTWAPSGALYFNGSIFFAGLRGQSLYQYDIEGKTIKAHFAKEFGRLRTVVLGPDNYFYILTNNTDGRGTPGEGDDKLIKVDSEIFF